MSAYMVDNENLSRMAAYFAAILDATERMGTCDGAKAFSPRPSIVKAFKAIPGVYDARYGEFKAKVIHRALYDMNRAALMARYGECADAFEPYRPIAVETREETRDEWQCRLFNIVRNYTYQCYEGNVPETALFNAVKGIEEMLAAQIAVETATRDWGCRWGDWEPEKGGERKSQMRKSA